MNFEEAKLFKQTLNEKVDVAGAILKEFEKLGRSPLGGISDQIRELPECQIALKEFDRAFAALRTFNQWMNKQFKKEIQKEQRELVKSRYKRAN
jgi:hypothetical protein